MNILRKTALNLIKKKKKLNRTKKMLSKQEQKILKTFYFSRENNLEVYYKNIDFLTIWIDRGDFTDKLELLTKVCPYDEINNKNYDLNIDILYKYPCVRL